uniref:WD repeat domain 49 n=1 Tax=Xenopus tropicalis TaxID=8364 RepID=A0A803J867_XENTR
MKEWIVSYNACMIFGICEPKRVLCVTMKRLYPGVIVAVTLCGVWITCNASRLWGDAITELAVDLSRAIHSSCTEENIIFSPLGTSLILGMIKLGARGAALSQIQQALKLQGNQDSEEFSELKTLLAVISEENKEFTFNLANALYLQEGFQVKEQYLHSNRDVFNSAIKLVDFQDVKASAETISEWVQRQTHGKISKMFSSGDFTPLTKMVLVNALYFKGEWKQKFSVEATHSEEFSVKRGLTVKVPMMHLQTTTKLGYFSVKNASYKVLELPYKGDKFSLLLTLPAEDVEIGELEKIVTATMIKTWFADMKEEVVEISLPRFKVEHKIDLKKSFLNLNITDIFNEGCDLSGITESPNLYISKVFQKVFLEINEEGSEAAASTGMQVSAMSMSSHRFAANRPFLFFIRHIQSGMILFMGKVMNPDFYDALGRDVESL